MNKIYNDCDMWYVTCDMWYVTCDMWHVTCDMWYVVLFNSGEDVTNDWNDEMENYAKYFNREPPPEIKNPNVKCKY